MVGKVLNHCLKMNHSLGSKFSGWKQAESWLVTGKRGGKSLRCRALALAFGVLRF